MEIIERVARALCAANDLDPDAPQVAGDCESGKFWQFHVTEARAAIVAMAEVVDGKAPTTHAMADAFERRFKEHSLRHGHYESFNAGWRAAIDAILTPAPNPTATTEDGGER